MYNLTIWIAPGCALLFMAVASERRGSKNAQKTRTSYTRSLKLKNVAADINDPISIFDKRAGKVERPTSYKLGTFSRDPSFSSLIQ